MIFFTNFILAIFFVILIGLDFCLNEKKKIIKKSFEHYSGKNGEKL